MYATSPLHSGGSPRTWGTKSELVGPTSGRGCYITPALSGITKDMGDKIRIGGAHKWAEMLHHPCILRDPQRKGDKIRIECLNLALWKAHKWAEMLHHPYILGDLQKRGQSQSNKRAKKIERKLFPWCPWSCLQFCRRTQLGFEPGTFQLHRHCFRVWPIFDIPLHRGGIHIGSNLVFICYCVLLKKTEHFEYRQMG